MHRRHCTLLLRYSYPTQKVVVAVLFLFSLSHTRVIFAQDSQVLIPIFQQLSANNKSNSQAVKYYEALNKPACADKRAGSNGLVTSANFVASELSAMGYQIERHLETVPEWHSLVTELEIVPYKSDNFVPVKAISIPWSVLKTDTSLFLLDLGTGTMDDFMLRAKEIQGKMLVIETPKPLIGNVNHSSMAEIVADAKAFGAAGVLFISRSETENSYSYGYAEQAGNLAKIPVVCITAESGLELRDWLREAKLLAFLHIRNKQTTSQAESVMAKLPGVNQNCIVIESTLEAQAPVSAGAVSFPSATLLEAARMLKQITFTPQYTLAFAFKCQAHPNLEASDRYMKWLGAMQYGIITQAAGKVKKLQSPARTKGEAWLKSLGPVVQEFDENMAYYSDAELHPNSAGINYLQRGYPIILPQAESSVVLTNNLNSNADTPLLYQETEINSNALLLSMLVYSLSQGTELPEEPINPKKLKRWLTKNGIQAPEPLVAEK